MPITVKDVAKAAGVSRTTVSNVFNGRSKCTEETRNAVLTAAKKLGYTPNLAAKSLITNQSHLIGLILPSYINTNTLTNSPFYNIIIDGIYSALQDEEYYDLIIFCIPHKDKMVQVCEWIDMRNVDGIIAIGEYDQDFLRDIDSKSIPTVLIDNYHHSGLTNVSYINSDDELGGYLATSKLIVAGYKKIGLCTATSLQESPLMQKRYEGYRRALKEVKYQELVFEGNEAPFEAGKRLGEMLYNQDVDGVFCTEDMLAVGVLHFMHKKGIRVGQEFGLIGFDNLSLCGQVYPELTTIDQNIFEKGEIATKTLLGILKEDSLRCTRLILPVRLVERESA
jgi:DNA-binding LacI/PurR family transcriptional regulator